MNEDRQILTKEFTLAEVLGVISGYLLMDKGFSRLQELMEWLVGGPVFTHQIPYIADDVKNALVKQFPDFNLDENVALASDVQILIGALKLGDTKAVIALGMELEKRWGKRFQVAPMQPFDKFEQPPLITPNIEGKALIVSVPSDEFPESVNTA